MNWRFKALTVAIATLVGYGAYTQFPLIREGVRFSADIKRDLPVNTSTPAMTSRNAAEAGPAAQPAPSNVRLSKSAQVDELLKTGSPVSAFAAYQLLSACVHARAEKPSEAADACGDISAGQLVSRRMALYKAADAGVHGAAMAAVAEGPDDYHLHAIANYRTDPVVSEWEGRVRQQLEAGAKTGDHFSLLSLAQIYEYPVEGRNLVDPVKSLMYWAAVAEQSRITTGKANAAYEQMLAEKSKALPAEQAQAAIAQGRKLAAINVPQGAKE